MHSIEEKIKTATTCVELCELLSDLDTSTRVDLLSDPSNQRLLGELITTPNDILELEKTPLATDHNKPLIALLSPIYRASLLTNIADTAKAIQQNFPNLHLLSWLTYKERNLILEAFDANLMDTITNAQLGSLLQYLDQVGQKHILQKLKGRLSTLVQTLEEVVIFQNISSEVGPPELEEIIARIFLTTPLSEIAKIINNTENCKNDIKMSAEQTAYLQRIENDPSQFVYIWPMGIFYLNNSILLTSLYLMFLYSNHPSNALFNMCAHLNSAACTRIILLSCRHSRGDMFENIRDLSRLTKVLIENKRVLLFQNQILKLLCQYMVVDGIKFTKLDLERYQNVEEYFIEVYAIEDFFNLLFYSTFWFDHTKYKEKILTPLAERGILAKIVTATPYTQFTTLASRLDESNFTIVFKLRQNPLPEPVLDPSVNTNSNESTSAPSSSASAFFNLSPESRKRKHKEEDANKGSHFKRSCNERNEEKPRTDPSFN